MYKRFNSASAFLTSRYLLALLAPLVITAAMQITWPLFAPNPISLYLLAVILCAWYGGLGPGLLCVAISFLLSDLFFLEPYSLFKFHNQGDLVRVVLFIMIGPTISLLSELMHREKRRSRMALNALGSSEERYRKLAENFPNGAVMTYDRDLRITFSAGRGLQKAGVSPDFFVGKSLSEIAPPEVVARVKPYFQKAFRGQIVTYECPFPDGQTHFAAVAPLLNGNELIDEILVISQNITERKQIEQALSASEKKLRRLLDSSIIGVIFWNLQGDIIDANDLFLSMTGYQRNDLRLGHLSWKKLTPPEYAEVDKKAISQMKATGACSPFEKEYLRKDGSRISVLIGSALLEGEKDTGSSFVMDITERKRVERAQRESQLRYETLVQSIDGIVWEADPKTFMFTFVSKQAERILGYPLERWFEGPDFWPDHMHPDDRDWAVSFCVAETARGVDHQFEYRMIAADGHVVWLSDIVTVHVMEGQSVLLRGVMVDITERKLAEEKLRQSESQLAEAQHLASVGSWNWDLGSNSLSWSDELHHIFGVQPSEFDPQYEAILGFLHPEDRDLPRRVVDNSLITHEPFSFYYRIIRPDGEERIIHSRGRVATDEQGTPTRMFGAAQDVTERKRAEDALREAERKYRRIFENASEGIFQATPDGRFTATNPALAFIFGFDSPADMISGCNDISLQLYADLSRREEFQNLMEQHGVVRDFESQALRKDGRKIWISLNARAVRDDEGAIRHYEGTAQEITDRKQAEDELIKQKEILQQIVDHIPVMINFTDSDGRVKLVNREWQHTLGWSLEEILSEDLDVFAKCYPTPQARQDALNFVAAASGQWRDFETQTRDGRVIDTSWARVKLSDGTTIGIGQDVSERKRVELALRQAERKYRDIFENAGEGIFQSTPDGRFLAANPALAHIHGFVSPEELIQSSTDISHQIYADPTRREDFKRLLNEQGALRGFEHQVFRKDGSKIWISVNARAVRDEKGEIRYYEGTAQDITDRKRAQEALRESEERYRDLVENSNDLICTHDLDGWLLSANRTAMELMGYSSDPYAGGINFRQILAPEVRDQFDDYVKRIRTDGAASGLMLVQTTSGEKRIWEYHCTLRTEGIAAPIVRGVARDITERKRAAEALRESEARYRELFENARDAIYVQDLSGVYVSVNRAAEKLCGFDRSEIIGKHFDHFIAPEYLPLVSANMSRKITDKRETAYEIEVFGKNGRRVPVELSSALIYKHGVPVGIQGIARDITERKRAERALRSYSRQLIKAQEAERQHIARELHDQIGQVLTAIRINLHTLGNSCDTEESRSLIDQGLGLIDAAIDQVRNLSFELRPSLLDNLGLSAALRWYSDQYTRRTGIRTKSASNLPEGQIRLRQELETACFRIVQEALTNVVRHANASNVFIDLRQMDHKIVLSIKDDGIGFKEPTNGDVSSTRLGLRGMKERALALGGALKIKSAPAQGTEIRATFPTASKRD